MKELTIERLRENPWNVMTCRMPKDPPLILLSMALFAADYCEFTETAIANAVRKGFVDPKAGSRSRRGSDIRESCDDRASRAEKMVEEVYQLYAERSDRKFYEAMAKRNEKAAVRSDNE